MRRIFFIHPDELFADFIRQYLEVKGFKVECSTSNIEGFTSCIKFLPDLIILNKEAPFLDARGFLIKRRLTDILKNVPAFIIGDFAPAEIEEFKREGVVAFIGSKVNPLALLERIHHLFEIPLPEPPKRTPMLLDIHAKGNILIIQIEGNLEDDKLVTLSYQIRTFCRNHELKTPKLFFIIPSLYPESITRTNLELLFSFIDFPELTIEPEKVQILTRNDKFISMWQSIPEYAGFVLARNYYEGFRSLYVDIDMETKVPVGFIKTGNRYILDIYDHNDDVVLPAMAEVSEELLVSLQERGVRTLKYYGDLEMQELASAEEHGLSTTMFDYITRTSSPVALEYFDAEAANEKQNLFFRKAKGHNLLFISPESRLVELAKQTLGTYLNVDRFEPGMEFIKVFREKQYIVVFIDLRLRDEMVMKLIKAIRAMATRRRTTIILLAQKINKIELVRYRDSGTDHIILAPFSSEKISHEVYQAVSIDRSR